jgi:hypothetical protein
MVVLDSNTESQSIQRANVMTGTRAVHELSRVALKDVEYQSQVEPSRSGIRVRAGVRLDPKCRQMLPV